MDSAEEGIPPGVEQLHVPYVNAFAGRDTSKHATREYNKGDMFWELTCDGKTEWPEGAHQI